MDRVFISHSWADNEQCVRLTEALRARGVDAWFDQTHMRPFDPISTAVREGIASSKALVAWYSKSYPTRRACREEMTLALLASENARDEVVRVFGVNPEGDLKHVAEARLFEHLFAMPDLADDFDALADSIAERVAQVNDVFGAIPVPSRIPWIGGRGWEGRTPQMVGRLSELWKIHDGLSRSSAIGGDGTPGRGVVVVSGMGGMGKSLLVAEYAQLFGSAHPGGVYWLSALGNDIDSDTPDSSPSSASAALTGVALSLGIRLDDPESHSQSPTTKGTDETEQRAAAVRAAIASHLDQKGDQVLWVIDDLRSGLTQSEIDEWRCPAACVRTLITTRDDRQMPLPTVQLEVASREESLQILIGDDDSISDERRHALVRVAAWLDGYPLALAVVGAYLRRTHIDGDEFLVAVGREVAELDAMVAAVFHDRLPLPGDHSSRVVATLAMSLRSLSPDCWDLLRLAMPLAEPPIPRWLVGKVFACLSPAGRASTSKVAAAIGAADRDSLWTYGSYGVSVHGVVRQVSKYLDADRPRQGQVAQCIYSSLTLPLDEIALDPYRDPLGTSILQAHARALILGQPESDVAGARSLSEYVGRIDLARGSFAQCYEMYLDVFEGRATNFGMDDLSTLTARHNLALATRLVGHTELADQMDHEILDARMRLLGSKHEDTVWSQMAVAGHLGRNGDLPAAVDLYTKALDVLKTLPVTLDSERLLRVLQNNLGDTLADLERYPEALKLHREAFAVRQKLRPTHPDRLITERNIGRIYLEQGKLLKALRIQQSVLSRRREALGDAHYDTRLSMSDVAMCEAAIEKRRATKSATNVAQRKKGRSGTKVPKSPRKR